MKPKYTTEEIASAANDKLWANQLATEDFEILGFDVLETESHGFMHGVRIKAELWVTVSSDDIEASDEYLKNHNQPKEQE